ncbi:DUF2795 domain-containing protein [Verrucosispora sp. WMMD703]|jgi:hypothetical protein|nr:MULTISPECIES: DUF2795 domain-containing protein [Micromonospora]MBQ1025512.1 DUF2795 domain-containing protein [Micromonospora sp. C95]MBQ1052575.1 DUF2795 domain-containing protein [Micromonospora sp. C51]WBB54858.1 DUF2795 domain-containing protein [Verrucosispora sp. WMMD573]WFE46663.1 DUF2795 domain-containing protein [Verrucosispora sp. WMMD1129]SFC99584.1 Protein of unknown function [Micromonospora sediminimaris]
MTDSGAALHEYLAGLDYPVSREDLIRWCQENGASTEQLQAVRALPVDQFSSPTELTEALGTLP